MNALANINELNTSWTCPSLVVLGLAIVGTICVVARKRFSVDGEVLMSSVSNKDYLREGWFSYSSNDDYFPKWYKVSISSEQQACTWEINFYSCKSDFTSHGGLFKTNSYIERFPNVIQEDGYLKLVAKEKPRDGREGELKVLDSKKIIDEPRCNSPLINQGGHFHEKAYGIAWKRFFFGKLFG